MSNDQYYDAGPKMGATFSPAGLDDYYMPAPQPDVVSPAPQRITPEMPAQIQDSLANLELNGSVARNGAPVQYGNQQHTPPMAGINQSQQRNQPHLPPQPPSPQPHSNINYTDVTDEPNYSPFPKLRYRAPNIPPPYEEREAALEAARPSVITSSDPEMQLAWAQDALSYADTCLAYERRIAQLQPPRATTPPIERQIRTDALNIVTFLAEQQHPRAEFIRGMWLEFGKFGFAQDKPEAFRCYKRASAKGYARAEYRMGMQFESTGESIKALQHYKAGEMLGDSASCYRMGMKSLLGQLGQAQDYGTAVRLIRQAADTADENAPQGAYVLGMLQGREMPEITVPEVFLPVDMASARTYVEKAAYLGFSKAQLKMGSAYELCTLGCDFNPALSLHYHSLAARQGEAEADMAISKWFLCGYEGVFHKNEELAFIHAQRAASAGLATGQFAMGYFSEIGMYVPVNITKAVQWYEQAAQNGNKDARGRIEGISNKRTLSKKDHENVAVSRIKSQYGSKRGPRPERFAKAVQSMPTISDEGAHESSYAPAVPPAGRVTPYPLDDRPATVAPYPLNDDLSRPAPQPGSGPGLVGGFFAVDQRPFSGAGDRRYQQADRPPRVTSLGGYPQGHPSHMSQPWPSTTVGNVTPGPKPPPQRMTPAGPMPQAYRSSSDAPPQRPPSERLPAPAPSSKIDIGFSAPIDSRADQFNRVYGNPSAGAPRLEPRRTSAALPARKPSPGLASNPRPPSRPLSAGPASASDAVMSGGLGPSPSGPAMQRPSTTTSSGATNKLPATNPGAPAPQRPPGKGPQTFEEMGVPQGKSDHDCLVM